MQLFTRTRTINAAHADEAHTFAVDMAQFASSTTGLDVIPWATVYGGAAGTVMYSARVGSQGAMAASLATLAAHPGYQSRLATSVGHLFTGPADDAISEFLSFVGSGDNVGNLVSITTAQCAPGRIAEAMAWGVDILSHASKVSGLDGALVRGLYGPWATLGWISLADTWDEVDASTDALAADATYLERIDDAGELLLAGSVSRRLLRRLC
ncbi:MAG TPA: hypothetical protein VIT64_06375 [Ilumatobacteraceae bacterium]